LQKLAKTCSKWLLITPPREIHMLRFIMEAYEGIAFVTTIDSQLGLVELSVAPGCEEEVAQVLNSEEHNLQLRPVWPDNAGKDSDVFPAGSDDRPSHARWGR
jgi:hypothetical protein